MKDYQLAVVISNYNEGINPYETIDAICEAGFKNAFIEWYNKDWKISQEEQLRYAKEKGLNIIFAHLGYQNINDLWIDEDRDIVERYKSDIKICHDNCIPMVVMHLTRHKEAPMYNEKGLKRVKEIVDYAKSLGVKVAFENTKIPGYLDYVIDNIDNDNVGICYDAGHCHCHFDDYLDYPKFKNRVFALHLHDNDTTDDQHLLPFDGTINWEYVIDKLKECNYDGYITMEIHYRRNYLSMSPVEFYKKGYEIGLRLKEMFEKEKKL